MNRHFPTGTYWAQLFLHTLNLKWCFTGYVVHYIMLYLKQWAFKIDRTKKKKTLRSTFKVCDCSRWCVCVCVWICRVVQARFWVQVMRDLRTGVKLKKVQERQYNPLPIEFQLTPYEMLMDDIRAKRYTLRKVMVNKIHRPLHTNSTPVVESSFCPYISGKWINK